MKRPLIALHIPVEKCTPAPPPSQFPPGGQFQQDGSLDVLEEYGFGASGFKLYVPDLQNEHIAVFPPVTVPS